MDRRGVTSVAIITQPAAGFRSKAAGEMNLEDRRLRPRTLVQRFKGFNQFHGSSRSNFRGDNNTACSGFRWHSASPRPMLHLAQVAGTGQLPMGRTDGSCLAPRAVAETDSFAAARNRVGTRNRCAGMSKVDNNPIPLTQVRELGCLAYIHTVRHM